MIRLPLPPSNHQRKDDSSPAPHWIDLVLELIVLMGIVISPWLFGMVQPSGELTLAIAVAAMAAFWGLKMLLTWRVNIAFEPISIILVLTFLIGIFQITPIPIASLSILSKSTTDLYSELLPAERETIAPVGTHAIDSSKDLAFEPTSKAGRTISLYPEATRRELIRLLAIIVLFMVVRNNLLNRKRLQRISWVAFANGILLSLFALIQFFSSPDKSMLYWCIESKGQVFGSFVNRNHFAMYSNLCIGLGIGVLVTRRLRIQKSDRIATGQNKRQNPASKPGLFSDSLSSWIGAGIVLMICTSLFSLSRGGFLSLVVAGTFCTVLFLFRQRNQLNGSVWGMVVFLALLFPVTAFLGWDLVAERFATIMNVEQLEAGRLSLWSRAMSIVQQFPITGTGFGTFPYLEPVYIHQVDEVNTVYEHAHNEYLEAWIEGGVIVFACSILIAVLTLRNSVSLFLNSSRRHAGLGLGLLFSMLCLFLHSVGEFGIHLPGIAFVGVVCVAFANSNSWKTEATLSRERSNRVRSSIGSHDNKLAKPNKEDRKQVEPKQMDSQRKKGSQATTIRSDENRESPHESSRRNESAHGAGGLFPFVGFSCMVLLSIILVHENRRTFSVANVLGENKDLQSSIKIENCERRVSILNQLTFLVPDNAVAHYELAQAHLDLHNLKTLPINQTKHRTDMLATAHLHPALHHILRARDLSVLIPMPHLQIAIRSEAFKSVEPAENYLSRVKKLCPADPTFWYLCGTWEFENESDQAFKSWQTSLSISDQYLSSILIQCKNTVTPDELLANVMPKKPGVIYATANTLYPQEDPTVSETRELFLSETLELFRKSESGWNAQQLHIRAQVLAELKDIDEAMNAYRQAMREDVSQSTWRLEYAEFLIKSGKISDAKRELNILLSQPKTKAAAEKLLKSIRLKNM